MAIGRRVVVSIAMKWSAGRSLRWFSWSISEYNVARIEALTGGAARIWLAVLPAGSTAAQPFPLSLQGLAVRAGIAPATT